MNDQELCDAIGVAVERALTEKLGQFFIEREQHYLDHVFIKDVRTGTDNIRQTACSVVTKSGIVGFIVLLGYGFVEWIRRSMK